MDDDRWNDINYWRNRAYDGAVLASDVLSVAMGAWAFTDDADDARHLAAVLNDALDAYRTHAASNALRDAAARAN